MSEENKTPPSEVKRDGRNRKSVVAKPKPKVDKSKAKPLPAVKKPGKGEGSSNFKYPMRAIIIKRFGSVLNFVEHWFDLVDQIEDPDTKSAKLFQCFPYLKELMEAETEEKRLTLNINHIAPTPEQANRYKDPNKKEEDA